MTQAEKDWADRYFAELLPMFIDFWTNYHNELLLAAEWRC